MDDISSSPHDDRPVRRRLASLRLRFRDPALESAYRADRFPQPRQHPLRLPGGDRPLGRVGPPPAPLHAGPVRPAARHGHAVRRVHPDAVVGLALTFTRFFGRVWEWVAVAIAAATLLFWVFYVSRISTLPAEYGYIGVILITAFTYTLLRLRFVLVVLITVIGIAAYLPYAFTAEYIRRRESGAGDRSTWSRSACWAGSPPIGWNGSRGAVPPRTSARSGARRDPTASC